MPRFPRPRRRAVSLAVGAVAAAGVIWGAVHGASLTGTPALAQVGPTSKPTPTAAPTATPAPTPTTAPKPTATPTPTPTPPAPGSNALYNLAVQTVASVQNTQYTYLPNQVINPTTGVYHTDCSGFVSYLLAQLFSATPVAYPSPFPFVYPQGAPNPYQQVPAEFQLPYPRAVMYWWWFNDLRFGTQSQSWTSVPALANATPGDIIAWNLPPASGDTGHVMVVAGKPVQIAPVDGNSTFSVLVLDSSSIRHYNDSRGPQGGVGSGEIHFQVNAAGQPIRFQFGPGDIWNDTQIAIGRLTPSALAGASVLGR
jgi:cell wall-associated NlpC family hydrolase